MNKAVETLSKEVEASMKTLSKAEVLHESALRDLKAAEESIEGLYGSEEGLEAEVRRLSSECDSLKEGLDAAMARLKEAIDNW